LRGSENSFTTSTPMPEEWKWDTGVWSHDGLPIAVGAFKDKVKVNFFQGASIQDTHKLFNSSLESKKARPSICMKAITSMRVPKSLVRAAVAHKCQDKAQVVKGIWPLIWHGYVPFVSMHKAPETRRDAVRERRIATGLSRSAAIGGYLFLDCVHPELVQPLRCLVRLPFGIHLDRGVRVRGTDEEPSLVGEGLYPVEVDYPVA
jgi:hypothetical protein